MALADFAPDPAPTALELLIEALDEHRRLNARSEAPRYCEICGRELIGAELITCGTLHGLCAYCAGYDQ